MRLRMAIYLFVYKPEAVYASFCTAVEEHTYLVSPGIWLPNAATMTALTVFWAELGINYFFVDTHGIIYSSSCLRYLQPPDTAPRGGGIRSMKNAAGRFEQTEGYPGDFVYRDFYRDIGFDLPLDYVRLHSSRWYTDTGFKYFRITGKTDHKEPYNLEAAEKSGRNTQVILCLTASGNRGVAGEIDRPPIVVAPYDAEPWSLRYEGPIWLIICLGKYT